MQPHVLSFETSNEQAIQELMSLAHRLGVKVSETTASTNRQADVARRAALFRSLFGAWQSEGETGDDLNRLLQAARYTEQRDIEL
ncbi:hypothetical protein [Hymenobacter baengnokdamensis]|uniref:hypothetical protein n=1 Tax=Hymenobacter baengnokdamensis TaxID=2615203 RepID=UPI0012487137|nr:hypothetical protein [Hymenobacter baengnokdamensis]